VIGLRALGHDGLWLILPTDAELTPAMFVASTKPPRLADLQGAVGGYVECVRFGGLDGWGVGWLNEEGKLEGLAPNFLATELCHQHGAIEPTDYIAGPFVVTLGRATPD
jgi:hypothetical protein